MKTVYPVIFTPVEGVVLVEVPDLGVLTQGEDLSNAVEMARDAISLKCVDLEDEGENIPPTTALKEIDAAKGEFAGAGTGIVSFVDIDTAAYRRMIDNKSVRRTVTLPNWLDYAAEKEKINVSKVLQDALIKELGYAK